MEVGVKQKPANLKTVLPYRPQIHLPPRDKDYKGEVRKVGIEIEFGWLTPVKTAELVRNLFGGGIVEEDPYRYHVRGTSLGDFRCELDTPYAHSLSKSGEEPKPLQPAGGEMETFFSQVRDLYGHISSFVLPCEAVCPPVAVADIALLEKLVEDLRDAGAQGTYASPFYAFSVQLNPCIAERGPEWITAVLKAYLLLADWLQAVIDVDATRQLIGFATPFSASYIEKAVDPTYWPDIDTLIDDYCQANPTRYLGLDMLPLFGWLDEPRMRAYVSDSRVKTRPTFHYRLPDSRVDQPEWSLALEWNRWCCVERLAENREALDAMGKAYLANQAMLLPGNWAIESSDWLWQAAR